jgi:hypothetical protein
VVQLNYYLVLFLKCWLVGVRIQALFGVMGTCKDVNSVLVSPPHTSLQIANLPKCLIIS